MELKLNISKKGLATTAEVINEEYTLNYGHVFRGKSAYEQAVAGGYVRSEEKFNKSLSTINEAIYVNIDSAKSLYENKEQQTDATKAQWKRVYDDATSNNRRPVVIYTNTFSDKYPTYIPACTLYKSREEKLRIYAINFKQSSDTYARGWLYSLEINSAGEVLEYSQSPHLSLITNKEIANNLGETSTQKVLSANQGKTLNESKVGYAEYNSSRKEIVLYSDTNKSIEIAVVDATAFIKDGMIASVAVNPDTQVLTITFNTDAGKQPIEINLSTILDNKMDVVKGAEGYIPLFTKDGKLAKSYWHDGDIEAIDNRNRVISYLTADKDDYTTLFGNSGNALAFIESGIWRMSVPTEDNGTCIVPATVHTTIVDKAIVITFVASMRVETESFVSDQSLQAIKKWQVVFEWNENESGVFKSKTEDIVTLAPRVIFMQDLEVGKSVKDIYFDMLFGRRLLLQWYVKDVGVAFVSPYMAAQYGETVSLVADAVIGNQRYLQKFKLSDNLTIDEVGEVEKDGWYICVTYSELVALLNESKLKAGAFYCITDYKTTTVQTGTKVADFHYKEFDIIVQATSENTISEDAKTSNGYKVKYCLSNDKSRFLWADAVNGKGVIYRMIDRNGNDCPYDFKNMLFEHDEEWYYTFGWNAADSTGPEDLSESSYDNYIAPIRFNADNSQIWEEQPYGMQLPCVIFNCQDTTNGKGIVRNRIEVGVKSAYIKAQAMFDNVWKEVAYNSLIENIYIHASRLVYGNTIEGQVKSFVVGNLSHVAELIYNKIELPQLIYNIEVVLNGWSYSRNTFNLKNTKGNFYFSNGSLFDNYIEDSGSLSGTNEGGVSFNALTVLSASKIRLHDSLDIVYANTVTGTSPLRFLDIDARGWGATTLTIPTSFPTNANYVLKVAKNKAGTIKTWCEADLVQ